MKEDKIKELSKKEIEKVEREEGKFLFEVVEDYLKYIERGDMVNIKNCRIIMYNIIEDMAFFRREIAIRKELVKLQNENTTS